MNRVPTLNEWISVINHWNDIIKILSEPGMEFSDDYAMGFVFYGRSKKTKKLSTVNYNSYSCTFCEIYPGNCSSCPVLLESGEPNCNNTPWKHFHVLISEACYTQAITAAIQERDYLLSLAPKNYLTQLNFLPNINIS